MLRWPSLSLLFFSQEATALLSSIYLDTLLSRHTIFPHTGFDVPPHGEHYYHPASRDARRAALLRAGGLKLSDTFRKNATGTEQSSLFLQQRGPRDEDATFLSSRDARRMALLRAGGGFRLSDSRQEMFGEYFSLLATTNATEEQEAFLSLQTRREQSFLREQSVAPTEPPVVPTRTSFLVPTIVGDDTRTHDTTKQALFNARRDATRRALLRAGGLVVSDSLLAARTKFFPGGNSSSLVQTTSSLVQTREQSFLREPLVPTERSPVVFPTAARTGAQSVLPTAAISFAVRSSNGSPFFLRADGALLSSRDAARMALLRAGGVRLSDSRLV